MSKRHWYLLMLILCNVQWTIAQDSELVLADALEPPLRIHPKIAHALLTKNTEAFFTLLEKDRKLKDVSVLEIELNGQYGMRYKQPQSVFHYLTRQFLQGEVDSSVLRRFLSYQPRLNVECDGLSVFYYLLQYVATHKIQETGSAEWLIREIAASPDFNINKPSGKFLPPLPYLLRTNYDFLQQRYDGAYINEDLIIYFIERGANVNTYDQAANNLITFSVQGHSAKLLEFLQRRGGNMENKNSSGKDAFYFALRSNDLQAIQSLVKGGYVLDLKKLRSMNILEVVDKTNVSLLSFITEATLNRIFTFEDLLDFAQLFPESRHLLLENSFYRKVNVPENRIPELVTTLEKGTAWTNPLHLQEIQYLKQTYVNGSGTIRELKTRLLRYPLFSLTSFRNDFYVTDNWTTQLKTEVAQKGHSILSASTLQKLEAEINTKRKSAQALETDYDFWVSAAPTAYNNFTKINFMIPEGSDYLTVMDQFSQFLTGLQRESLSLLGISSQKIVDRIYGMGVKQGRALVCVKWYRDGVRGDDDMLTVNSGFSAFETKISTYLQASGCDFMGAYYLGSRAYDEERLRQEKAFKKQQCDNCIVDDKKTEVPRIMEKYSFFGGTYTDKENGTIVMKNGKKFRWDYKNERYRYIEEGIIFDDVEEFKTFDLMYARLIEKCQSLYCK